MSTKITLKHNNAPDDTDFHLYLECFDKDGVYLQMRMPTEFSLTEGQMTVRIPREVFKMFGNEEVVNRIKEWAKDSDWEVNYG